MTIGSTTQNIGKKIELGYHIYKGFSITMIQAPQIKLIETDAQIKKNEKSAIAGLPRTAVRKFQSKTFKGKAITLG